MSEVTDRFVDRLVERVDWLTPLVQDRLADNFGEVLPHAFLGEVTRQLVARVCSTGGKWSCASPLSLVPMWRNC